MRLLNRHAFGKHPFLTAAFDSFRNGRLRGWACNHRNHRETVNLEVRLGDALLQTIPAELARSDINAAGIAGDHGFDFVLPPLKPFEAGALTLTAECRGMRHRLPIDGVEADIVAFFAEDRATHRLGECRKAWGTNLERDRLTLATYRDAVYVPFDGTIALDRDLDWGLYAQDGTLIPEAAYRRGADLDLVGQSPARAFRTADLDEAPFETMVYGGPVFSHYGHFLISTLCRCWAIDGTYPVLFHSSPPVQDHRATFIVELMRAAGLSGRSVSFTRPTRIREVVVPQPALYEQHSVSRDYLAATSAIGRAFAPTSDTSRRRIYFSKSRLQAGVTGLDGEFFIDRKLRQAGFAIVHPESLSLADQIGLFRHADLIVGMAGSAFHTLALAPQTRAKRVILAYDDFINSNYLLIDKFAQGRSEYYTVKDYVRRVDHGAFMLTHEAINANHLADKIISLTEG